MKLAVQYQQELEKSCVKKCEIENIEVPYVYMERINELQQAGFIVRSIILKLSDMNAGEGADILFDALTYAEAAAIPYIVIDTRNVCSLNDVIMYIEKNLAGMIQSNVIVLIENGYVVDAQNHNYIYSEYSDAVNLRRLVEACNGAAGKRITGISLDVGAANVIESNVRSLIEECADDLMLIHINDNDGKKDCYQMPFTFTTGRGLRSTDWYHIIGALARIGFRGDMVFNITGTLARAPKQLHEAMLNMVKAIYQEWNKHCTFEEYISEPGKQVILFGAGRMAENYIVNWGKQYPPLFLVDNNPDLWGQEKYGYQVKSPEAILEVEKHLRNVVLCNSFYEIIGKQLKNMGVKYHCYNDEYYM